MIGIEVQPKPVSPRMTMESKGTPAPKCEEQYQASLGEKTVCWSQREMKLSSNLGRSISAIEAAKLRLGLRKLRPPASYFFLARLIGSICQAIPRSRLAGHSPTFFESQLSATD